MFFVVVVVSFYFFLIEPKISGRQQRGRLDPLLILQGFLELLCNVLVVLKHFIPDPEAICGHLKQAGEPDSYYYPYT